MSEDAGNSSKKPTIQPLIRPNCEGCGTYSYTPPHSPAISLAGNTSDFTFRSSYQLPSYNSYQVASGTQLQAIVTPQLRQQHMQWASVPESRIPPTPSPLIQPTTPSSLDANPPLVRTLTLQIHPNNSGSGSSLNPYGIYPHTSKAVLNIEGDLDSVAAAPWSPEEIENRRKIVQFWRHQIGATINTNFAVVATNERQPNSICISCIYWEEKGECYVTSVDCIYLLESLISVRFTVEEKNRIRRNLEGFRPLTVSKAKPDSENFFKLIMAFPNPKPRNIEKDVKIFPWKILGMAMKKIIGKYSASYSSSVAILPQAPNPTTLTAPINKPTVPATESLPVTHPPASDVISSGPSSPTLIPTTDSPIKHHRDKEDIDLVPELLSKLDIR